MTTAEILRGAADVIRRNGWHQGDYYDHNAEAAGRKAADCGVCARGAINLAACGDPLNDYVQGGNDANDAMTVYLGWTVLTEWNDDPDRTADEVIAALEAAAEAQP